MSSIVLLYSAKRVVMAVDTALELDGLVDPVRGYWPGAAKLFTFTNLPAVMAGRGDHNFIRVVHSLMSGGFGRSFDELLDDLPKVCEQARAMLLSTQRAHPDFRVPSSLASLYFAGWSARRGRMFALVYFAELDSNADAHYECAGVVVAPRSAECDESHLGDGPVVDEIAALMRRQVHLLRTGEAPCLGGKMVLASVSQDRVNVALVDLRIEVKNDAVARRH